MDNGIVMENEISGFLISEYGFRKVRSMVPREDDPVDTNLFSCVLRIHEIHYLYFSEDMKHFSLGIRHENPKGEAGTKGRRYWSYMALPKPIYSIDDAHSLVEGICDFSYMETICQ